MIESVGTDVSAARPPTSSGPEVVGLKGLLPLVAAGLLALVGRTGAAVALAGLAAALILLQLLAPTVAKNLDQFVVRVADRVGRIVGASAAIAGWLLILCPVWLVNHLVGIQLWGRGSAGGMPGWVDVQTGRGERRSQGPKSFLIEPPILRTGPLKRLLRFTLLMVPVMVGLITTSHLRGGDDLLQVAKLNPDPLSIAGLAVTSYAHEHEPWFDDYVREFNRPMNLWDPYVGTTLLDLKGRYLNISDGRRVTYQPTDPQIDVWYFGGSTMFGIGQRDDHTIPSVIARRAEADGVRIRSTNFGVSSFVNWQENELFAQALSIGPPPDLVVFYDGVNEFGLAWERFERGDLDPTVVRRNLNDEAERELFAKRRTASSVPASRSFEVQGELAVGQYSRGVDIGRRLAGSAGIPVMHFWQPSFLSKVLTPADSELSERLGYSDRFVAEMSEIYRNVPRRVGEHVIDVSDSLNGVDEPVLFDQSHTNERGAAMVADRLYTLMKPRLSSLVAAK